MKMINFKIIYNIIKKSLSCEMTIFKIKQIYLFILINLGFMQEIENSEASSQTTSADDHTYSYSRRPQNLSNNVSTTLSINSTESDTRRRSLKHTGNSLRSTDIGLEINVAVAAKKLKKQFVEGNKEKRGGRGRGKCRQLWLGN